MRVIHTVYRRIVPQLEGASVIVSNGCLFIWQPHGGTIGCRSHCRALFSRKSKTVTIKLLHRLRVLLLCSKVHKKMWGEENEAGRAAGRVGGDKHAKHKAQLSWSSGCGFLPPLLSCAALPIPSREIFTDLADPTPCDTVGSDPGAVSSTGGHAPRVAFLLLVSLPPWMLAIRYLRKPPCGNLQHVTVWNSLQEVLVCMGYGFTNRILKEGREEQEREGKFKDDEKD